MSKSPDFLIPALGGAALVAGIALAVATRGYGTDTIDALEAQMANVQAQASSASEKAAAEASRAAELEQMIAEVQQAAATRGADLTEPAPDREGGLGLGRTALPEEIAAWDVDVLPDGRGLPVGSGNAYDGEEVFVDLCASCHGDFAEGVDNWPVLSGGFDTLADEDPVKTVGSYWPHLSTAYDYIYRSMPFGAAGTLTPDETYAIVAYILYSNDLIEEDFELNQDNLGQFEMHNRDGFVIDDRAELEYSQWRTEPCMQNCKPEVEVTMRSVFLVDTPPEGGTESTMNPADIEGLPSFTAAGASFIPEAAPKPEPEAVVVAAATEDDPAALLKKGEKVFRKCKACHQIGAGAEDKTGPALNGIMGAGMGASEGFRYSKVFTAAAEEGRIWDEAAMAEFLAKPKSYMKGTKMSFSGLKKDSDVEAIIAYLKSAGG